MRQWLRIIGLIILGLIVGGLLGLYLGWIAWPTEFTDANPSVLAEPYQQDYLLMIATVYAADGDLQAAQQYLAKLGDRGPSILNAYVLDEILLGKQGPDVQHLARLAHDLGFDSPALQPYLTPPTETVP
ncbi:MAG: hypothetical protein IPM76_03930 [Chloroflexi bacterium]|nr:hypothetical protein [Chloroflexota bacterium]